ncbi:Cyclic-di-AMP phosphodiesterase PgpH [Halomicronema hongdechloris C2206]|uniref:Cyclic-di-AMP phosphodiesterase PgpH n=1 Tax=Halomicronema hongdechloris C2206 TaxID=1641165 RepID=A0A1Z3HGR4_9CYAN|nr:HDIG domain-containing metalloprotein [Halomicronema hongdechloris]ASC69387.1 Cyclic-di-AMP phosphodiesterase PgpH [Halomicronema hongdechloris C2206]
MMKLLRLLIGQVEQRWKPSTNSLRVSFRRSLGSRSATSRFTHRMLHRFSPAVPISPSDTSSPPPPRRARRQSGRLKQPRLIFAVAVLSLTAGLGQRFYNQPGLQVDSQAPETIIAPKDATVVDTESTEAQQMAARNGVLRVLMLDPAVNEAMLQSLDQLLQQGERLRQQAGTLPFLPTHRLSTAAQRYIQSADQEEWQSIWSLVQSWPLEQAPGSSSPSEGNQRQHEEFQSLSPQPKQVARELITLRQQESSVAFATLGDQLESVRRRYQRTLTDIEQMDQPFGPRLLQLSEEEWQATKTGLRQVTDRMITQGISPGLPSDVLKDAIGTQLQETVPSVATPLATQMLTSVLTPNLIEDPERTRLQAEKAAEAVEPVTVSVQQGEVIVAAGETISQADFVLLDHFNLSQRRFNWLGFVGYGVLVAGGVSIFLLVEHIYHGGLRRRDYVLITLMVMTTAGLLVFGSAAYGLPAVGLLVGSFYGSALGATVIALLGILVPIGTNVSSVPLVASVVGALVGSVVASRLRSREELALLGGGIGLTQGGVYLILTLIVNPVSPSAWYGILTGSALQGAYGLVSSILALGLSPYLEHVFDLVTPIRLAELSNPNRPLLKRLSSEAPGTFQHTMFVASLAEAAARVLGCNVELVRAGTLYHDIGKMHDPQGFIENQMGGPNKHDQIADPWLSATIIKKHVTEGIVMARKCRLPKALRAFIPEHQGTMLISYFYHQAKERAAEDATLVVREEDFRYDGPIPQSPETGIVMLADSCEAALRSLKEATPEEALTMVNRILRARWKDDQLVDSGLTREHMRIIADIFVQVWQQYNHKRIAYPKAALAAKPSA